MVQTMYTPILGWNEEYRMIRFLQRLLSFTVIVSLVSIICFSLSGMIALFLLPICYWTFGYAGPSSRIFVGVCGVTVPSFILCYVIGFFHLILTGELRATLDAGWKVINSE